MLGGPQIAQGEAGRLSIVSWRTWRLKRKAISTNDGEIQSHGGGRRCEFPHSLFVVPIEWMPLSRRSSWRCKTAWWSSWRASIGTDSRGGFDAINKNESPLLGLSNVRSALQAFQLREQLQESLGNLIWISGDWNLGDCLTKKDRSARLGILQFFKTWVWKLKYDPGFIQSEKRARRAGQSAVDTNAPTGIFSPFLLPGSIRRVTGQEDFGTDATVASWVDQFTLFLFTMSGIHLLPFRPWALAGQSATKNKRHSGAALLVPLCVATWTTCWNISRWSIAPRWPCCYHRAPCCMGYYGKIMWFNGKLMGFQ